MVIDIFKYLKPKKEEKEKLGSQFGGGWGIADLIKKTPEETKEEISEETQNKVFDISKYIIPKGEVKAEETKKEEPSAFDTLNEDIEKNYKKYQSIAKKLEAYQAEYDYAPNNIKPSIAANYNKLAKENNDLIKQLQIDIGERDQIITTINKANFMKYKQLTGLPEGKGISAPIPSATPYKPIIEGLPISPKEKPKTLLEKVGVKKPTTPEELKMGIETSMGTWEEQKKANPELQKMEDFAYEIFKIPDRNEQIAAIQEALTGTPKEEVLKDIQSNLEQYKSISPPKDWKKAFEEEGILKTVLIGPSDKYSKASNVLQGLEDILFKKENPGLDFLSSFGWKGMILLMGGQLTNLLLNANFKVGTVKLKEKELTGVFRRAREALDPETGKFSSNLSDNDFAVMKQINIFLKTTNKSPAARRMLEKIVEKTGGLTFPQQVNIFGGKLYSGIPIDEMVKSIVKVGKLTQDIANQLKVMNPVDVGLVFQELSLASPAIASKLASQFVELVPQKITKIPKAGEEMTPEELEQFEKLKKAEIIPKEEIEPTKAELKEIERPVTDKEKLEEAFKVAKMKETAQVKGILQEKPVIPGEKIEKPIIEPEKIEPEPTPEEIKTVFMTEENLGTTAKNREYFLGKFGKLFTETKKAEDTLIKQKFNEMNMLVEYEEDEIYKLAFGKEKMRIPVGSKTDWMEALGKSKYMQIFRDNPNLSFPDVIATSLGMSEDELREQITERIRTAPKEVTLESAKQALIDEGSSVFMQVTAQMDAYRILLDEIEGGEYSFETPQNVKRLNAKISALKSDSKKLMDEYEKKITEIQKKGVEEKYEKLKKELEAKEKIGIEVGIKKGLKVAKAELKGRAIKGMPEKEIKEGNKLIQQIQIMVKDRGFTKKQFSDIKMTHGGARSLSGKTKRMTIPQLKAVLKAVEAARPHRIGHKKVITPKTEKKIQSLKDNLIDKLQMTEEAYQEVLKDVGVYKEPKYIDAKNFITEEKGKELIYRLIDESNILRITEPLRIALEKNPEAKKIADGLDKRIKLEGKERLKDPHELNSMRKYIQIMEGMTDAPFFSIYQDLIDTHLENRADLNHLLTEFDEYKDIIKNEDALKRVESWILAKSNLKGVPEVSKDITDGEVILAKKIQGILKDYETKARTEKFLDNIEHPEDMPQFIQYRKEINKAKDIYESKGYDDLVSYMKTQEWGIIKNSYDPLQVVSSKVRLYKAKATTLGKSHIEVRKDIEYKEQDKNIIQRIFSYKRQMDNLSIMRPKIRAFVTLVDKNLDKFKDTNRIRTNIEVFFRELKGYDRPENWFDRGINRLYAQAMTTIIMGSPALSFRNLGQNFGLGHDKTMLIDPRNKKLTPDEIDYLDTYVQQAEFMRIDWFMTGEKPLSFKIGKVQIGLERLTNLIKKVNLYPRSDIANRHWGFWGKINQVKIAFDKNVPLAKNIEGAKFSDMTLLEQKRALQILSKDGQEAMEKYVTRVYVDDTHFLYERAQRSPAEMGRIGRVMGNLMLFPRAYWEKLAQHSKKMTGKNVPYKERLRAFKVIASVLIGGMLVSAAYKKTTGRIKSPYDPLELLAYAPGGLMISTVGTVSDVYIDFILASKGDEKAMADLTTSLPALADMFIPFYNYALRGLEAFVVDEKGEGGKNIDRLALRKLRMLIDKEYQVRGGAYKLERNAMEKWQYFLSGAGIDVTIKEREKKEKEEEERKGKFPRKVKVPEGAKSIKGYFKKVKVPVKP